MKDISLEDVKEIKDSLYQNTICSLLTVICVCSVVYLVVFDEHTLDENVGIIGSFVVAGIVSKIMSSITGKEVEKFLSENPDVKKKLDYHSQ